MTPTKLSPEDAAKITELLPWLASIDRLIAIGLAIRHPDAKGERRWNNWDWEEWRGKFTTSEYDYRVTIPMPPLRRALRREEFPETVWINDGVKVEGPFFRGTVYPPDEIGHAWSANGVDGWDPFYIDEEQPPMVISTGERE